MSAIIPVVCLLFAGVNLVHSFYSEDNEREHAVTRGAIYTAAALICLCI